MRIAVRVKPGAKRDLVVETETGLDVFLKARAIEGAANQGLIEILARHFKVRKSEVEILVGKTSRTKLVRIGGPEGT